MLRRSEDFLINECNITGGTGIVSDHTMLPALIG